MGLHVHQYWWFSWRLLTKSGSNHLLTKKHWNAWFSGKPWFTLKNCRSRIKTVFHANFTLFHANFTHPIFFIRTWIGMKNPTRQASMQSSSLREDGEDAQVGGPDFWIYMMGDRSAHGHLSPALIWAGSTLHKAVKASIDEFYEFGLPPDHIHESNSPWLHCGVNRPAATSFSKKSLTSSRAACLHPCGASMRWRRCQFRLPPRLVSELKFDRKGSGLYRAIV